MVYNYLYIKKLIKCVYLLLSIIIVHSFPPDAPCSPGQLYTLKSRRGRTLHVIKSAAPSWRRLAHALNLSTSAVDSIEISSFYQIERACETSLCRWISEAPAGQPVCWATLLQALRDADLNSLATDLQLVLMENAE